MRKQGNVTQSDEKNKCPEKNPKEGEIYKFSHKEFKVIFLKLNGLQENTATMQNQGICMNK